jgi:conjugative transfer signal peptidase TraF
MIETAQVSKKPAPSGLKIAFTRVVDWGFPKVMVVMILIIVFDLQLDAMGCRLTISGSLPSGLWRIERVDAKTFKFRPGDIVALCPPSTPALELAKQRGYISAGRCPNDFEEMDKPIGAIAGMKVTFTDAGVMIDGQLVPNTPIATKDGLGHALPQILTPMTIPEGQVFLLSNYNPKSFDSRYFGPVPVTQVIGLFHPVWTK